MPWRPHADRPCAPRPGCACFSAAVAVPREAWSKPQMDGGTDARRITIHAPEDFAGMRAAGRLAAETLDMITPHVRPGVVHRHARHAVPRVHRRARRGAGAAELSRLSEVDLHLDQPRRLPRHSGRAEAGERRHPEHRRHGDPERLARRFLAHVCRRHRLDAGAQPDGRDLRGDDARRARGEAGRDAGRHRPCDPELCGGPALQRGARLLRPRHRAALPRAAERAAFRPPRRRPGAAARHVLHHRADGERRPAGGEGAGRRLDRGDARPQPVGAVRAHDRRDRDGLRDLHAVAGRVQQAALRP